MATVRRFRSFMLAHVELVEIRGDGSPAVIGLSGSGDAVAMVVQPETINEFVSSLCAVRPLTSSLTGTSTASGVVAGIPAQNVAISADLYSRGPLRPQRVRSHA